MSKRNAYLAVADRILRGLPFFEEMVGKVLKISCTVIQMTNSYELHTALEYNRSS